MTRYDVLLVQVTCSNKELLTAVKLSFDSWLQGVFFLCLVCCEFDPIKVAAACWSVLPKRFKGPTSL